MGQCGHVCARGTLYCRERIARSTISTNSERAVLLLWRAFCGFLSKWEELRPLDTDVRRARRSHSPPFDARRIDVGRCSLSNGGQDSGHRVGSGSEGLRVTVCL
ncbi:hypothetical protein NDU88_010891 [Pleurodeles waltl]|uniref:Uncharacterized protein n=1 Tax=Pleurodeles waltl TaxID=8319 RepID=A0AAV7PXD4_PLEWA|nr:hypothetical protein NDU88_010891 [Pleurodeles waltl]